jgi:xylan 1,4-beta-xylosidase
MKNRERLFYIIVFLVLSFPLLAPRFAAVQPAPSQTIVIDANAPTHPFPHFWEHMFGSERAVVTLRESYRRDLRDVKQMTGFEYVRFHAIFHDEVGIYDEDAEGHPEYNFSYVDQVYDGLLANGVRPFIELSFMPKKLAAKDALHAFWYKQNACKRWPAQVLRRTGVSVERWRHHSWR